MQTASAGSGDDGDELQKGIESVAKKLEDFSNFVHACKTSKAAENGGGNDADVSSCPCTGFLYEPFTLSDGSTFCSSCIEKLPKQRRISEVGQRETLRPNVILANLLRRWHPCDVRAVECRKRGNAALVAGNISGAIKAYSEGLEVCPKDHLLLAYRSKTYSSVGKFIEAFADAEMAGKLSPLFPKAYYRRSQALKGLGKMTEAVATCLVAATLENAKKSSSKGARVKNTVVERFPEKSLIVEPKCQSALTEILRETEKEISMASTTERQVQPDMVRLDDFECVLCCRLLLEPLTIPCGHVFCRSCINRSLDHRPFCPSCRHPLQEYLATYVGRKQPVTAVLEKLIKKYFASEYQKRQTEQEQELQQAAGPSVEQVMSPEGEIPIFVCVPAFPGVECPLHIFEPRYRLMMRRCIESGSKQFGMCESSDTNTFSDVGTMLVIREAKFLTDGRSLIDTIGGRRFKVLSRGMRDGYNTARVRWFADAKVEGVVQIREFRKLNKDSYRKMKTWFEDLAPQAKLAFEKNHGKLPDLEEEPELLPDGPAWTWWAHGAFQDQFIAHEILQETDVRQRIRRALELREHHAVLSSICRQM
eukprot:m.236620 g.236620  ORF g.236620 m.236620 type:complete len:591 (+) comp40136_c0_seq9:168-1940(+)